MTFLMILLAGGVGMIVYGIIKRDTTNNNNSSGSDGVVDGIDASDGGAGDGGGDGGGGDGGGD